MGAKGYRSVRVWLEGSAVRCDPDPVQCYWVTGPDCIRWTFKDLPRAVASVVIEWKTRGKGKPMFRGHGHALTSVGSHLADIITFGNIEEEGRFQYAVHCFDKDGNVVAFADPDADNSPTPPN